jgi:uncharacterized protein (TIGR00299 family) protein
MTTKHAYLDCFSGISGDMLLGALIDLGAPVERLRMDLATLPIGPFELAVQRVDVNGISARQVDVTWSGAETARHFHEIEAMIEGSPLPEAVQTMAVNTFRRLAEAEAGVHGCAIDEVHFHEVGAVDAIVDIVGVALCRHYLSIDQVTASPLPLGTGFVNCRHGRLPLPAPATLALLKQVPIKGVDLEGELVTPTGAALITEMAATYGPLPAMTLAAVGYGAGHHRFGDRANVLRIVLGHAGQAATHESPALRSDSIELIETAIDDLNPEVFGYLMERLLAVDAVLDVYWIPVYMKKNRPGTLVQVLCQAGDTQQAVDIIFSETSTLGIRILPLQRLVLPRAKSVLETSIGPVEVKRVRSMDGIERLVPEYDACRRLAREKHLPLKEVYALILAEASAESRRKP